jgi:hypothetical protein
MVEQGNVLGNRCECDPGWTQMHVGDSLHFIPCVIPNCKHAVNFFLFSQVLAAFLEEWCQWENGKNTISIGCYQNLNYESMMS